MRTDISSNLADVQWRIDAAARRAGREVREIKLVSVSKTHPASILREAMAVGVTVFGENKVQEAEAKIIEIGRNAAEWHLIGHLQSNKARKAAQLFDVIHSIDSLELAERLERICSEEKREEMRVLVQVDLAGEDTKSGVSESDLPRVAEFLKTCEHLRFDGLMILPPFFDDAERTRPFFKHLREIRNKLQSQNVFANSAGELSMGMSHDFEIAIEEGATIIRVGTAIFGERSFGRIAADSR